MVQWQLPAELAAWIVTLSGPLHGRLAWRLLPLLRGLLFAQGRRTVASWLAPPASARSSASIITSSAVWGQGPA